MREIRNPHEILIDKALLLVLMDLSADNDDSLIGDRLKCMKLPYLAANDMFEKRKKGFSLRYFRDQRGPL